MFLELLKEKETLINQTMIIDDYNDLFETEIFSKNYIPISLIPIVCLFSVTTNLLSIFVFLHSKMKDPTFKYMLLISISNCLYAGLLSYSYVVYCNECSLNKSYVTLVFKIFIEYFFTSCLAMFSIFVEIVISIHRYFVLKNNNRFASHAPLRWIVPIFFLISVALYFPVIFTYEIKLNEIKNHSGSTTYMKVKTDFGQTALGKWMPIMQSLLRIFLSTIVLSLVNIVNIIEFRKRFKKKLQLKLKRLAAEQQSMINKRESEQDSNVACTCTNHIIKLNEMRASRNITLMIIWTLSISIFGSLPKNVYIIYKYSIDSPTHLYFFSLISFLIFNFAIGLNFFGYYLFNRMFREIINGYFKKIICFIK